jgi:hypothetical protein
MQIREISISFNCWQSLVDTEVFLTKILNLSLYETCVYQRHYKPTFLRNDTVTNKLTYKVTWIYKPNK